MLSVTIAVVLAVGASGSAPAPAQYGSMGAELFASTPVGSPRGTLVAPRALTVAQLHWEATAAGQDGGGSTFTLAVTADDTPVCSAIIACTATGSGSASCSEVVSAGKDLHIEVTASGCTSLPAAVVSAVWTY